MLESNVSAQVFKKCSKACKQNHENSFSNNPKAFSQNVFSTLPANTPQGDLHCQRTREGCGFIGNRPVILPLFPCHSHTHIHTPLLPTPFQEYADACKEFPAWAEAAKLYKNNISSLKVLLGESARVSVCLRGIFTKQHLVASWLCVVLLCFEYWWVVKD